jgi:tetratricopeptide (TPR) repeat protein
VVATAESSTNRLALEYLSHPGAALLDQITAARREVVITLRAGRLRDHHQIRYLTTDVGYLSGILAYAALDHGHPRAALAHAEAAWQAAELVGSHQLRAWVRGTQSLILRFAQRYAEALDLAEDGLRYATTGTARARLLAGIGQCHANMGDAQSTRRSLTAAASAMDSTHGVDQVGGLFTFSQAKLHYYSGSSLIWLDGGEDARRAVDQAHTAIALWERSSDAERSVADEALAHVYAATAFLQLRELEGAEAELEPILSTPSGRRISWIAKRMDRVTDILGQRPYGNDHLATALLERITTYT